MSNKLIMIMIIHFKEGICSCEFRVVSTFKAAHHSKEGICSCEFRVVILVSTFKAAHHSKE